MKRLDLSRVDVATDLEDPSDLRLFTLLPSVLYAISD